MAYLVDGTMDEGAIPDVYCLDDMTALKAHRRQKPKGMSMPEFGLPAEVVPRRWHVRRPDELTIGFFSVQDGYRMVCERFREAVEAHEPGRHLFVPVELTMASGRPITEPHYLFFEGNMVDAIDIDASKGTVTTLEGFDFISIDKAERHNRANWRFEPHFSIFSDVYLLKEKIAGMAFWAETVSGRLMISEALFDDLRARGVAGILASEDATPKHVKEH